MLEGFQPHPDIQNDLEQPFLHLNRVEPVVLDKRQPLGDKRLHLLSLLLQHRAAEFLQGGHILRQQQIPGAEAGLEMLQPQDGRLRPIEPALGRGNFLAQRLPQPFAVRHRRSRHKGKRGLPVLQQALLELAQRVLHLLPVIDMQLRKMREQQHQFAALQGKYRSLPGTQQLLGNIGTPA
ncbi:hypothetical protein D3C75_919300 [compost metagenome]